MRNLENEGGGTAMSSEKRLPSLDGLRAIAASMVVLGHAGKSLMVGRRMPYGAGVVDVWGPVGVTVFFVISGFLITRLLLEERSDTGAISLRSFFARRAFRILPAFWTYVAIIGILYLLGMAVAEPTSFVRALTFSTDYINPRSWVLNHSWSLSVEEQFYLFWPFLLVAVGALHSRGVAMTLIVAAPLMRLMTYYFMPELRPNITSMLHLRIDALMIGCWAALELAERPDSRVLNWLAQPRVALFSAIYCLVITAQVRRMGPIESGIGYGLEAFCALSIILWATRNPWSRPGRVLNSRLLVHLGAISYSLYLWQQVWLAHETRSALWVAPLGIVGALASAELSYRLVEKPMMRLRSRLRFDRPQPPLAPAVEKRAA
jgi:peptidoglycan/LPS O-acetylase OafA/YrhL